VYALDDGSAPEGAAEMIVAFMDARLEQYLAAIERLLGQAPGALLVPLADESASAHARRVILARAWDDPVFAGRASATDPAQWSARSSRFALPIEGVPERLQRLVLALCERGADDVVRRLRPFELARAWAVGERDALRALMAAARAGLLELRWELRCDNCRAAAASAGGLGSVGAAVHCAECGVDTSLDLSANVEAVFSVAPALRKVSSRLYCASSPTHRPHAALFASVGPGEVRRYALALPRGGVVARAARRAQRASARWEAPPARVRVSLGPDGVTVQREGRAEEGAPVEVELCNESERAAELQLEHPGDWALATAVSVAAMPEFARWFEGEAPARGAELSVGAAAALVVECAAVEALFEREGDVAASARVERALAAARAAIESAEGGAVLRVGATGLVALFDDGGRAERAFARARVAAEGAGAPVAGALHEGPCVMVRRDDRIELLGAGMLRARSRALRGAGGALADR
jgi:hypothetical protein